MIDFGAISTVFGFARVRVCYFELVALSGLFVFILACTRWSLRFLHLLKPNIILLLYKFVVVFDFAKKSQFSLNIC